MQRLWPNSLYTDEESELIDATRQVLAGYRTTAALPFDSITVRLDQKFLALAPEECVIAVLASRSWVQIFWSLRHFHYSDWDTAVPDAGPRKWSNNGALLGDDTAISEIGRSILQEFWDMTKLRVAARWPEPDQTGGPTGQVAPGEKKKELVPPAAGSRGPGRAA